MTLAMPEALVTAERVWVAPCSVKLTLLPDTGVVQLVSISVADRVTEELAMAETGPRFRFEGLRLMEYWRFRKILS